MAGQQRGGQQVRRPHSGYQAPMPARRGTGAPPGTLALLPLRLFLGVTFCYAGLQKLANPDYLNAHSPTSVQSTILSLRHQSPIGWLLGLSAHAPVLVGIMIALGELAVGMATLAGIWVRLTAAGGMLLSLTFFLTVSFHTHPYYYGSDIVFVFAWSVPLLLGSWPDGYTLDAWIRRRAARDPDPQRRALVIGATTAGALAALGGVAAAATALVGRSLHRTTPVAAGRRRSPVTPSPHPDAGASHPTQGSGQLPGRHLVAASALPPGRALRFTDNHGNPAWLLHEQDGTFRAFSAVCTHAGCPVDLSGGQFVCPCHGGTYSATTGAVLGGPPPSPLPALSVRVVNGDVRLL
jgi:thiosulfate dehydrogenase [quinone] large subunit